MLAEGYAHSTRDVELPEAVRSKMLPQEQYGKIHFPSDLKGFSTAVKAIVDGWNKIAG